MKIRAYFLLGLALLILLASCTPVRPLVAPGASLQQVAILPDGRWKLALRIENFSSQSVHYGTTKLHIDLGEISAGDFSFNADIVIAAENGDMVETTIAPAPEISAALRARGKANPGGVLYELKGSIVLSTEKENREFPFEHKSRLSPVPGLTDVYR